MCGRFMLCVSPVDGSPGWLVFCGSACDIARQEQLRRKEELLRREREADLALTSAALTRDAFAVSKSMVRQLLACVPVCSLRVSGLCMARLNLRKQRHDVVLMRRRSVLRLQQKKQQPPR